MRPHRLISLTAFAICCFALSTPLAMAACKTWQLPKKFNAVEDSGAFVVFDLKKKSDSEYSGTVYYNDFNANRQVKGKADAKLDGGKLDIAAAWKDSPSGGGYYTYYNGSIDPSGFIGGLRKNPSLREGDKNREVFFKSKQTATCADKTYASDRYDRFKDRLQAHREKEAQDASKKKESQEASASSPPTRPNGQRYEPNVNRQGGDYRSFEVPIERYQSCKEACEADGKCKAYTYVRAGYQKSKGVCWLKDSIPAKSANRCCVSGLIR